MTSAFSTSVIVVYTNSQHISVQCEATTQSEQR